MNTNELKQAAIEYKKIKAQIEGLTESLNPYRVILESACLESPDLKLNLDDGMKIMLVEMQRENFKLKEAKIKLGDALVPFITVSRYSQLRVK